MPAEATKVGRLEFGRFVRRYQSPTNANRAPSSSLTWSRLFLCRWIYQTLLLWTAWKRIFLDIGRQSLLTLTETTPQDTRTTHFEQSFCNEERHRLWGHSEMQLLDELANTFNGNKFITICKRCVSPWYPFAREGKDNITVLKFGSHSDEERKLQPKERHPKDPDKNMWRAKDWLEVKWLTRENVSNESCPEWWTCGDCAKVGLP